jgi:hypothetical protein
MASSPGFRRFERLPVSVGIPIRDVCRLPNRWPLASPEICGSSSFDISVFEATAQVEGIAASSFRLSDACGVARSKNRSSSTGKGSTRVEFFSAATSTTVSKSRN